MEDLSKIIAAKLTLLRKANKFTQIELAEKLNYSDKAISKWEHGDSLPPIDVLHSIAKLYGVTLDYLVSEEKSGESVPIIEKEEKMNNARKICVALLGVTITYFVATFIYIYMQVLMSVNYWQVFIYGIPVSCIVCLIFNFMWGKRIITSILLSVLSWSILLCFYVSLLTYNLWPIFIIGAPAEVIIFLCEGIRKRKR